MVPQKCGFLICFVGVFVVVMCDMFLSLSCVACGLCCLSTIVWFSSSYCDAFLCVGDSYGKVDSIK